MTNAGSRADSKPAVYNERSTGTSASNSILLDSQIRFQEGMPAAMQRALGSQISDTNLNASTQSSSFSEDAPLRVGRVLLAMPYVHCYKVQISGRQSPVFATSVMQSSTAPIGVTSGNVIPPGSTVLIWKPSTGILSYILGVLPVPTMADSLDSSDFIQQGGNSGPKEVPEIANIPNSVSDAMGWVPQVSGRPMDGTSGEFVHMSETGIGILIDSFQAFLRVNETCGLWLNYFDNYTKLAGLTLEIQSYCEQVFQVYDEGENFSLRGYCTYPWEATGMYSAEEAFTQSNDKAQVQTDGDFPFADEDLQDFAQTPIFRLTDYTGYIGQGFNRTLMVPSQTSGKRRLYDSSQDVGLFNEFLALDGSYGVRSAKGIFIAKYPCIPNPRRTRKLEDAKGDDLSEENDYKFSGTWGEGDDHIVKDFDDSQVTEHSPLLRAAGVLDMMAHHYNWKVTHPFAYHKKDYRYPEESDSAKLGSVKYFRGNYNEAYVELEDASVKIKIDDRYEEVEYFNTASFFHLTDDGGLVIGDGYGSQITMTGGQIRLEAGGDVMFMSGSRVVTMANDVVVKAKDFVDISATDRDVRIKAERNMQLMGGNDDLGGVLIESKGTGVAQMYGQNPESGVYSAGITLLSRGGEISAVGKDLYLRSGVGATSAEETGSIVMDCANGLGQYTNYAASHSYFNNDGLFIWHGARGQDTPNIDKAHYFGPNVSAVNGPLLLNGNVSICENSSLGVSGSIYSGKSIYAVNRVGCKAGVAREQFSGGIPAESWSKFVAEVTEFLTKPCDSIQTIVDQGVSSFTPIFTDGVWTDFRTGNTTLLDSEIGFSFRDASAFGGAVYGYDDGKFSLLEARWQQLDRTGLISGGGSPTTWTETSVDYQGNSTYPWPGKINWADNDTMLSYESFLLVDPATGAAKSREDDKQSYEEPRWQDWSKTTPDGNYSL